MLGFGRRKMVVTPDEAKAYMLYQLGALNAFAKANGTKLQHMKLHGAFYNMAAVEKDLADDITTKKNDGKEINEKEYDLTGYERESLWVITQWLVLQ